MNEMEDTKLNELQKEIETKINEFGSLSEQLQKKFRTALFELSKKGYKISEENVQKFMERFWHIYPTRNANEWEVAIPIFIPFNIGWFDRIDGGYNIFTVNKYTKWLGEEIPSFVSHEINLPPSLGITVDGNAINFKEGTEEKIQDRFGKHLTLIDKGKATIKQGHEFDLIAEIIDSGSLPFMPHPVNSSDLRESSFTKIYDELNDKYNPLQIFDGKFSYQGEAWKTFEKYGAVGVFWGMSFGKTILGTYAMSRITGQKLLVVPTRTLQEHWEQFFKWNCPELLKEVSILTYQGMSRKKWNEEKLKDYNLVVFDECLTKDTNIVLSDGGIKSIEKLENKENVIGGNVINKFSRNTHKLVKIYSSFGELESTETHPHIVLSRVRNKHKNQWYNLNSKQVKTKLACELKPKLDFLLVPERIPHTKKTSWTADQLAFVSLIMCDGHIEKGKNVIKISVSKKDKIELVKPVFIKGIASFGIKKFWEFTNKRGDYTIGCSSANLRKVLFEKFKIPAGKKSGKIDITDEIFYAPLKSIKAFIDVAFSCEGWVNYNKRTNSRHLYFSCRSKNFVEKLKLLLKKFGIHSNYTVHIKHSYKDQYQLQIGSADFNRFSTEIGLTNHLKASKLKLNKVKFMNNVVVFEGKKYRIARINKIKTLTKTVNVFDFETSTHTFLANGILTHNCHFLPADSFSKLATIKAKYRIGLSATPYREDGRTNYIMALTGLPIGLDWRTVMSVLGKEYHTVNVHVVKDLEAKYSLLKSLYNPERRTIIFVNLIDVGKKIASTFELPFISGATKDRLKIISENKSFVASRVLELGISIKDLEHIIEVDFLFGSRREEVQRTGRLMHSLAEGKVHDIIFTKDELESYGKRLYGLYEKGFRYKLIPHLAGVQVPENSDHNHKKKTRSPSTAKGYGLVVTELFNEGYFQNGRKLADIISELVKRGISKDVGRNHVFGKLNSFVRTKKLFKIKTEKGYEFKAR